MNTLRLQTEDHTIVLALKENNISEMILESLPIDSRTSRWGEEIYFPVPVNYEADKLTKEVSVGDVAYWPEGQSLAIFFGPTPMSEDEKPVPADDVQVIGTVQEGFEYLPEIHAGESLKVTR